MPLLCYEVTGDSHPNERSSTNARDGQVAAVLKSDDAEAQAQIYSELVANRLAAFLGIPVASGVLARACGPDKTLLFASLRAEESGYDLYDFTETDPADPDDLDLRSGAFPDGLYTGAGHVQPTASLCEIYPQETAAIAVFDLWIGNADRAHNFKAEISSMGRGILFALDQGSSLLSCRSTTEDSLQTLADPGYPSFHPFQKLVRPLYCGQMLERILSMPEWAMLSATTFDDTVGNVTLDQQFAAFSALDERKKMLEGLVERILL